MVDVQKSGENTKLARAPLFSRRARRYNLQSKICSQDGSIRCSLTMAKRSVSSHEGLSSSPLDFFRDMLREHGLDHIWTELEAKLSDIFITQDGSCRLEIVEIIRAPPPATPESRTSGGEANVQGWAASTTDELNVALAVCDSLPPWY